MPDQHNNASSPPARPTYRWPWFVLVALIAGILLSILWMSREVERTRRLREPNPPALQTTPAQK